MTTLGLLGCGKIGSAVMTGYCSENGWQPDHVFISARTASKAQSLQKAFPSRVTIVQDNQTLIDSCDIVFIGLLPNVAQEVKRMINSIFA